MRRALDERGWTYKYLDGATPKADRVHRIGQHLPVTVYRLICKDTIEEKVVNLHAKKAALSEDVLSGGASALSAETMLDLLSQA